MYVEIKAAQELELRGGLSGVKGSELCKMQIKPRGEYLPQGVVVSQAEVVSGREAEVHLILKNNSCRTVRQDSGGVLAALEMTGESSVEGNRLRKNAVLVGPSCEVPIKVDGLKTQCLLDSGSQVTIIAASFYRKKLSHLPLYDLQNSLIVTGAGGQEVPYLGYVVDQMSLPKSVVGTDEIVETMALVGPDTQYSRKVPVIVGTNTFRSLARVCVKDHGKHFLATLPMRCEAVFAYRDGEVGNVDGRLGKVKLLGKDVLVPAGGSVQVSGMSHAALPLTQSAVLVQEPTSGQLPEGIQVVACKVPTSKVGRVKVRVMNVSDTDVVIRKKQVIADIFSIRKEYAVNKLVASLNDRMCRQGNGKVPDGVSNSCVVDTPQGVEHEPSLAFKFGPDTPEEWRRSFTRRLESYRDVFTPHEFDLGKTDAVTFDIELEPGPPIWERPRTIHPRDFNEATQHIKELMDANIIEPSNSPYASPIVLVRKKSGNLRMCVDYRRINSRTWLDSYAVPKVEDLLLTLSGAKFFTSVDLCKAYYQVPLAERAKRLSAFTTPFGLFQWLRMPMGLKNSAPCFQRLMKKVFCDMNLAELIVFLDDILIHGSTLEELEEHTVAALERLRLFKLKLDPGKCGWLSVCSVLLKSVICDLSYQRMVYAQIQTKWKL